MKVKRECDSELCCEVGISYQINVIQNNDKWDTWSYSGYYIPIIYDLKKCKISIKRDLIKDLIGQT